MASAAGMEHGWHQRLVPRASTAVAPSWSCPARPGPACSLSPLVDPGKLAGSPAHLPELSAPMGSRMRCRSAGGPPPGRTPWLQGLQRSFGGCDSDGMIGTGTGSRQLMPAQWRSALESTAAWQALAQPPACSCRAAKQPRLPGCQACAACRRTAAHTCDCKHALAAGVGAHHQAVAPLHPCHFSRCRAGWRGAEPRRVTV